MKTKSSVKTSSDQRFVFKSRKAERKTMRQMKKQKKTHMHLETKAKEVNTPKVNIKKKSPKILNNQSLDWRVVDRNKERAEEIQLQKQFEKSRCEQMKHANEDEDKEIKQLAKQLKLDKKKTVGKSFLDDGLDCILFIVVYNTYLLFHAL